MHTNRSQFYAKVARSPFAANQVLIIILLIAAVLRFNHINQPFTDAFSWRQVSVAMMAENYQQTNWNILYPEVNWSGPGPNYQGREFQTVSYLAALLYTVLGQQDWIGRMIATLFGLWGIFALYHLVCSIWSKKYALASAAVMAVLPGSIVVDRSFLPDPAMVALVVTSLWLLMVYLQTDRLRYLVLACIIGAWGFCTKIPGLIVGLPAVYALVAILGVRRVSVVAKIPTLVFWGLAMLAPVVAYYLWARQLALSYPPYHFAGGGNWVWDDGLLAWSNQGYFLPRLAFHLTTWMWTAPAMILAGLGLLFSLRHLRQPLASSSGPVMERGGAKAPWLFHWWLLAGLVYYLIGAKELVENPWNLHVLNPAIAVLAGYALVVTMDFFARSGRAVLGSISIGALLLLVAIWGQRGLEFVYRPYASQGYELGLALRAVTQPGDLVVTIGTDFGDPVPIYYSQRRGWGFPPANPAYDWTHLPADDNTTIQLFEELRTQGAGWFAVVERHYDQLWQDHLAFMEHLDQSCELNQQTPAGIICRIMQPDEMGPVADLPRPAITREPSSYITQEFRYHRPEASAVFLVWGMNGWQVVPEEVRPVGTLITNQVMYTLMSQQDETFVSTVHVPPGTAIEYGFLVMQTQNGVTKELWDAQDGKEYRLIATQDGGIDITSSAAQPSREDSTLQPSRLQGGWVWLSLGLVVSSAFIFVRRRPSMQNALRSLTPQRLVYLRDLLSELVARDMKLRYRRSVLGIVWSLLNPVLQLLVFGFVFRYVLPLGVPNYVLFLFTGLLVWNWLQASLYGSTTAIIDGGSLIKRPGFPAAILPIVTVSSNLVHFLLALPILLLFLLARGIEPTLALFLLPLVVALQFVFTLSLTYFLATIHVFLRDTQHLVTVFLLLFFYLTPIFYDPHAIPARFQTLYQLNPVFHLVEAYRTILLRGELPPLLPLATIAIGSILLLYVGYGLFMRTSYRFVEEL